MMACLCVAACFGTDPKTEEANIQNAKEDAKSEEKVEDTEEVLEDKDQEENNQEENNQEENNQEAKTEVAAKNENADNSVIRTVAQTFANGFLESNKNLYCGKDGTADTCLILEKAEDEADIIYYEETKENHLVVLKQGLVWKVADSSALSINRCEMQSFDQIESFEEYMEAYPTGISETPMNYETNGLGEALNEKAQLSSSKEYTELFSPELAVGYLLNVPLADGKVSATILAQNETEATVQLTFKEDGTKLVVEAIRPWGENGIWIPRDHSHEEIAELMEEESFLTR